MTTSSHPELLLDEAHLATIAGIAFDDFKEILVEMIDEAPALLDRIEGALVAGDRAEAARTAHGFRGMLLNFGCPALAARLLCYEREGPAPGTTPAAAAAELRECWSATEAALQEWMVTTGSATPGLD